MPSAATAFKRAVEAHDIDAASACLSPDVSFHSPVVFKPYEGRDTVTALLAVVADTFEDFEYVSTVGADDARDHVLVFKARVGDRRLDGVDILHLNDDGLIDDFTVMLRPLSGTLAMAEAMKAKLTGAA
jgi:limonene-1,2-epoxide hydrolase